LSYKEVEGVVIHDIQVGMFKMTSPFNIKELCSIEYPSLGVL